MRRHLALLLFTVVAGGAIYCLTPASAALGQSADQLRAQEDVRQGIYEQSHILSQIPSALPAYIAGFCGLLLLGRFLGFYEMGPMTTMILIAIIGGIVYRFYLPH